MSYCCFLLFGFGNVILGLLAIGLHIATFIFYRVVDDSGMWASVFFILTAIFVLQKRFKCCIQVMGALSIAAGCVIVGRYAFRLNNLVIDYFTSSSVGADPLLGHIRSCCDGGQLIIASLFIAGASLGVILNAFLCYSNMNAMKGIL